MKLCANCIEEKISVIPRKLWDGRTVNLCGKCANSGKMLLEIYEEKADDTRSRRRLDSGPRTTDEQKWLRN